MLAAGVRVGDRVCMELKYAKKNQQDWWLYMGTGALGHSIPGPGGIDVLVAARLAEAVGVMQGLQQGQVLLYRQAKAGIRSVTRGEGCGLQKQHEHPQAEVPHARSEAGILQTQSVSAVPVMPLCVPRLRHRACQMAPVQKPAQHLACS